MASRNASRKLIWLRQYLITINYNNYIKYIHKTCNNIYYAHMHNSSRNAWQSSMGYPSAPNIAPNIAMTLELRLGFGVRYRVTRNAVKPRQPRKHRQLLVRLPWKVCIPLWVVWRGGVRVPWRGGIEYLVEGGQSTIERIGGRVIKMID